MATAKKHKKAAHIPKLGIVVLACVLLVVVTATTLHGHPSPLLSPAGDMAEKERNLIYFALSLSLIVVIPVFVLLGYIIWKYRDGKKSAYTPDWDHSRKLETIWWLIPGLLILVLAIVTWNSSHALDPFKSQASSQKPLVVQVVALQWKWLFIYPEENVASVNLLEIPQNRPISLQITSDAPMNSFWIPQLSGQVYAMSGMSTRLHFTATKQGDFIGRSANISGKGFSGMTFTARSTSKDNFADWVTSAAFSGSELSAASYAKLAAPSENNPRAVYAPVQTALYDSIINKYMPDMDTSTHSTSEASL